jgi:hypothetical protein
VLRRSATQTPHETPTLRRSNTQVSHTSFASSIRTTARPDVPRPVYYAIQFHELSEHVPDVITEDVVGAQSPATPRQHVAHSPENSGGSGGGLLSALGIGRFWSSEKNKDRPDSSKSPQAGHSKTYSGSFTGPSAAGAFRPEELISSSSGSGGGSRNSRHSVA